MKEPQQQEPMNQGWYYHSEGIDHGPMSRSNLAETLQLMPFDGVSVWHASLPDWVSASDVSFRSLVFGYQPANQERPSLAALLLSFRGRVGRARYFSAALFNVFFYAAATFAALGYLHEALTSDTGNIVRLALSPPFVWIGLALTAKRLHDLDRSALHLLWVAPSMTASALAPPGPLTSGLNILGGAVELWLVVKRGTSGPNRFGPDPLRSGTRGLVVAEPERKSGWRFVVGVLAAGVIGIAAYEASDLRLSDLLAPSQLTCSRPEVVETTKAVILAGPQNKLALMIWLGGERNVRVSLTDIRTQSYDQPVNGVTCTASLTLMPIDPAKASNKDGSTSEINYTVQATDANDGHYVVTILE